MDPLKQGGKVRVIARIRGSGDEVPAAASISVKKLLGESSESGRVVLSFAGDQTASNKQFNYEVDECYGQEASNDAIYLEEIKPLISSVFEGTNATVFVYGARGSGKTYTIQGLENVPGLITLSLSEFLSQAEKVGNSVSISFYEVVHDRVFDLLDSKRREISVLEDAKGKIILKGLTKVAVESISDFHKSYLAILRKPSLKAENDLSQRSHIGITINVLSSPDKPLGAPSLGRMNLVDLAGYEDRRLSCNGANLMSMSKINKSLYAVHNVLNALIHKETRVPYRESKLTRMLQESLGGMNKILMITCMDPSSPEDSVKALSLACRSCQAGTKAKVDDITRVRSLVKTTVRPSSSTNPAVVHSSKAGTKAKVDDITRVRSSVKTTVRPSSSTNPAVVRSSKAGTKVKVDEMTRVRSSVKTTVRPSSSNKPAMVRSSKVEKVSCSSASARKQVRSVLHSVEKKSRGVKVEGRKLFEERKELDNVKKENMSRKNRDIPETLKEEEEKIKAVDVEEKIKVLDASTRTEPSLDMPMEEEVGDIVVDVKLEAGDLLTVDTNQGNPVTNPTLETADDTQAVEDNLINGSPVANHTLVTPDIIQSDKENRSLAMNEGESPPLSVRLQELSNNLKSLWTSTPSNTKTVQENCGSIKNTALGNDTLEPGTPVTQPSQSANDRSQYSSMMSPWERFHVRSSGMKDSLVQELLNFLNTASREELMGLKGIGEARATYVLTLREESSEPFKNLEDLKKIGLSSKQINGMIRKIAGDFFA